MSIDINKLEAEVAQYDALRSTAASECDRSLLSLVCDSITNSMWSVKGAAARSLVSLVEDVECDLEDITDQLEMNRAKNRVACLLRLSIELK